MQPGQMLPAGIDVETPRKFGAEFGCAVCFYLSVLVQVILAIVIWSSVNTEPMDISKLGEEDACPEGFLTPWDCTVSSAYSFQCISEDICNDLKQCVEDHPEVKSGRLLSEVSPLMEEMYRGDELPSSVLRRLAHEEGTASPERVELRQAAVRKLEEIKAAPASSVWDFMASHFYQPLVLFSSAFICAAAWLVGLTKATKAVVWGTIVADFLLMVVMFLWFLIDLETINIPAILGAVAILVGGILGRHKVNEACVVFHTAMEGFAKNLHLFAVCFGVQFAWVGFFAIWIAAVVEAHGVVEAGYTPEQTDEDGWTTQASCSVRAAGWINNIGTQIFFTMVYWWTTYFMRNINLMMITANLVGWYFEQENFERNWVAALKWSVGPQGGANAMASAIMGLAQYLLGRVNSSWDICVSVMMPLHWIPLCLACCLKQILQTYTKFGLIAATISGKGFCETAPAAFNLLKSRLGEALLCDYLGSRIMNWLTYVISVGIGFAAWAWADAVQDINVLSEIPAAGVVTIVILFAYMLSYPIVTVVGVVLLENAFGSILKDDTRRFANSVFASAFMGSATLFILRALSHIVVSASDVILVCFAIEAESGKQQERFKELYSSIKATVGVVSSDGVVEGTAPAGTTPESNVIMAAPPATVVGNAVP